MSIFEIQTPQQSIGFQFWKLHMQWQKKVADTLSSQQITHTQFVTLAAIAWFEEQNISPSQAQVCKLMSLEKMTFSKAIRQLETMHLVYRKKSEVDARSFLLSLSEQAILILPQLMHAIENLDKSFFGVLNKYEKQQFNQALLKLNKER